MPFDDFMPTEGGDSPETTNLPADTTANLPTAGKTGDEGTSTGQLPEQTGNVSSSPTDNATPSVQGKVPGQPEPAQAEDEIPYQSVREYLQQHPEAREVYDLLNREVRKGLDPKLEQRAAYEKALPGVPMEVVQTLGQVYNLIQNDPAAAADYLAQEVDKLRQVSQPDPLDTYIPQTETESYLLQQLREKNALVNEKLTGFDQWKSAQEQRAQQAELTARRQEVINDFSKAEQDFGIRYSDLDRAKVWEWADKSGLSIEQAIWALNGNTMSAQIQEKGRQQGNTQLQNKVTHSSGNPGSIVNRTSEAPEEPKSFDDLVSLELQKLGST